MPAARTTIIISDLSREQCLTVPRAIRADIGSLTAEFQLGDDLIDTWSELAFLSRLVIIVNNEQNASAVYKYLKSEHPDLKIHLSESIVRRHKSFDATLKTPISPKPDLYEEKEPSKSDDEESLGPYFRKRSNTKVLLEGLKLNTAADVVKQDGTISPMSPTITLDEALDQ